MITSENDARKLVRMRADAVWWVEHGLGGTVGMPDCFAVFGGSQGWMELKTARRTGDGEFVADFEQEQVPVARTLARSGVNVVFLSGVLGTVDTWLLTPWNGTERVGDGNGRHRRRLAEFVEWDLVGDPWWRVKDA